jgi:Flp pilus assembly pilin Flp
MRNLSLKAATWLQARKGMERQEGQTIIEYALIVAVVSVALILLMAGFGTNVVSKAVSKVSAQIV